MYPCPAFLMQLPLLVMVNGVRQLQWGLDTSVQLLAASGQLGTTVLAALGIDCLFSCLMQGITDPLYLQHPPQYYLIEEDAEAVRYSSLFRHRLIANRPDWMNHASPLQLAPPGSKRMLIKAADVVERLALPSAKEV